MVGSRVHAGGYRTMDRLPKEKEPRVTLPLRLEPRAPRLTDAAWRQDAAGSALTWDPDARILSFEPPTLRPKAGWSLRAGAEPDAAARIVRIRGRLPQGMFGFAMSTLDVDHYVPVSTTGEPLSSGVPAGSWTDSGSWYSPERIRAFAQAAGLSYSEEVVADWHDLRARFPDVVPASRLAFRLAGFDRYFHTALGIFAVMAGLGGVVLVITAREVAAGLLTVATLPTGLYLLRAARRLPGRRPR